MIRRILVVMLVVCGVAYATAPEEGIADDTPAGPTAAHSSIAVAEATNGLVENPGLLIEESLVLEYGRSYRLPLSVSGRHSPHKVSVQAFGMYQDVAKQEPAFSRLVFEHSFSPRGENDMTIEIDTRKLPRPRLRVEGRPSESAIAGLYFDVQVNFFEPAEFDRLRVLLIEKPQSDVTPTIASDDEYLPLERVMFHGVGEIPPDRDPGLGSVKLGRYLPGGGVIPDLYLPEFQYDRTNSRNYLVTPDALDRLDPFLPRRLPQGNAYDDIERASGKHYAEAIYGELGEAPYRFGDWATGVSRIWIQPLGPYRLDFQTLARGVLESTLVEASLPDLSGSVRLEPAAGDDAFDISNPPDIIVDLSGLRAPAQPGLYPVNSSNEHGVFPDGWLPIQFQLTRMRRGGIPSLADVAGQPLMNGAPQSPGWARPDAVGRFSLNPFFLRPGSYRARLVIGDYLLDSIDFDVGGRQTGARYGGDYAAPSPLVEFGGVQVTTEPVKTAVLGAPVAVRATWPEALDLDPGRLFVQLYLAPHYSYGCARRIGRYVGPAVRLDRAGTAVLPAPPEPGGYEVHLFRPYDWSDAAKVALEASGRAGETPFELELWKQLGGAAPFVEPLGRTVLEVDAPAAPGAIRIDSRNFETNVAIPVTVNRPRLKGPAHHYELELWLSARTLPGGVFRRAAMLRSEVAFRVGERSVRENFEPVAVAGTTLTTDLMIAVEEAFELRLWDATAGYYVDRLAFRVFDPHGPPMPPTGTVVGAMADWPARNDPLRGLEAWLKPPVWCEDPVFPEPPTLRVVEHIGGDAGSVEDNAFVPVEAVFPGHPFFVEAEFETAPPDDLYRVDVGPKEAFLVERSENPRVYRSGVLNVVPKER